LTPGGEHRLARPTGPQPLGDAGDEQIDDIVLREITLGEDLVLARTSLLPSLRSISVRSSRRASDR
jgi:hypothetical protein